MKAAFITQTGPASVLNFGDVADPELSQNQVLIKTEAVAVNPIDLYIRSGNVNLQLPQPYVVGCDVAGTVIEVGSNVQNFRSGDRVWGSNQGLAGRQGTFAERCAVDECWLYPTPDGVSSEDVAAVSLTGITAHLGLHLHANLQPNEVVFVNGGTGGVGSAVVQLAKAVGAVVITTVGSEEKRQLAEGLGADRALHYRAADFESQLQAAVTEFGPINVWFETLRTPNPETTFPLMARRGRYVLMAGRDARPEFPVGPFYVNDLRACGFAMFNATPDEQAACARDINTLMVTGQLKALIGAQFSLRDAVAAHQLLEDNTLQGAGTLSGKIVLTP